MKPILEQRKRPAQDPPGKPLDSYVGCPSCEAAVDIRVQLARTRRELAECLLDLLHAGISARHLFRPLENVAFESIWLEQAAMTQDGPLRHLSPKGRK